jgi:transcriptional regulator with XRE-family HTH domain
MTGRCRFFDSIFKTPLQMKFGDRVKTLRNQKGYTQAELSERSGLTLRSIQRIEHNEVKPSLHSVRVLSSALDEDLSDLKKENDAQPYEFEFKVKITDMNQLVADFKTLLKNNWKILILISILIFLVGNYTEIKSGIVDGWNNR